MIGRRVEILSTGGIQYFGIVRAIKDGGELGELFELGSDDPEYRRLVYVVDRAAQIREIAADEGPAFEPAPRPASGRRPTDGRP